MKKMFKTTILTAALSAGMALSAMAAETPAKTWEDVKNSEDPMEIIQVVETLNQNVSDMDTDYLMNMTLRIGEDSLPMNTTGNIKVQNATNEAMKLVMTMNMNAMGENQSITAFYTDGWYYYDMGAEGKYKLEMNYADALQNAQAAAMPQSDLSYIKDASVVRNGDLTTIYYTMDGAAMTNLTNQVLSQTADTGNVVNGPGVESSTAGLGMNIGECKGEYTLDANGNIIQQRILMNMDMSVDDLTMGYEIFMEMNIKAMGDSVVVTIPSTEGYPTMEEYLQQILAESEAAA